MNLIDYLLNTPYAMTAIVMLLVAFVAIEYNALKEHDDDDD
jgi:hypothetical protein